MISNFCHVLNVVFFLLGEYPASGFCVPTFWNILFHLKMEQMSAHKFRHQGFTQNKEYNKHRVVSPSMTLSWDNLSLCGFA